MMRHLGSTTIIISLFFHLLLARFFIFTFTTRPVAHKPVFVFLGSILGRHDLRVPTSHKKGTQTRLTGSRRNFPLRPQQSRFASTEETSVKKPVFSKNVKKGTKEFLKSNFEEKSEKRKSEKDWADELGVALSVPRRRPLRLSP